MQGVKVDWGLATIGEFAEFQQSRDVDVVLVKVITACPWGDPAELETYGDLKMPEYDALVEFVMSKIPSYDEVAELPDVLVDWNNVTRREHREFTKAAGDIPTQIELLRKVVLEVPQGPADQAETYLNMTVPEYMALFQFVNEERGRAVKK